MREGVDRGTALMGRGDGEELQTHSDESYGNMAGQALHCLAHYPALCPRAQTVACLAHTPAHMFARWLRSCTPAKHISPGDTHVRHAPISPTCPRGGPARRCPPPPGSPPAACRRQAPCGSCRQASSRATAARVAAPAAAPALILAPAPAVAGVQRKAPWQVMQAGQRAAARDAQRRQSQQQQYIAPGVVWLARARTHVPASDWRSSAHGRPQLGPYTTPWARVRRALCGYDCRLPQRFCILLG